MASLPLTQGVDLLNQSFLLCNEGHLLEYREDVLACSIGLNSPIETLRHPLCNNFAMRAYYGVAAAGLTQPDRVPSLVQSYTEFASRDGGLDALAYEVGKDLKGVDAFASRMDFVARAALAVASAR